MISLTKPHNKGFIMNKNTIFLTALGLAILAQPQTSFTKQAISNEAVAQAYDKTTDAGFKYVEYLFIVQPANKLKDASKTALTAILTSVTTAILARPYVCTSAPKLEIDISTISAALLGSVAYNWYLGQQEAVIKKETLISFLKDYAYHRQYIPVQLQPAFDEISNNIAVAKIHGFSKAHIEQIFEIIQHLVEHEFAKRYEKDKVKDADSLGMLKTITDISKNLK